MIPAALAVIGVATAAGMYGVTRDFVEAWPRLVKLMKGDFRDEL